MLYMLAVRGEFYRARMCSREHLRRGRSTRDTYRRRHRGVAGANAKGGEGRKPAASERQKRKAKRQTGRLLKQQKQNEIILKNKSVKQIRSKFSDQSGPKIFFVCIKGPPIT